MEQVSYLMRKAIAKSSEEEAYFDITWINFPDEEERANVWYYTNWEGLDVSTHPAVICFVCSPTKIYVQFKRLKTIHTLGIWLSARWSRISCSTSF